MQCWITNSDCIAIVISVGSEFETFISNIKEYQKYNRHFTFNDVILYLFVGEVMVCVLDFKRDVGLWHGIICVSLNICFYIPGPPFW